MSQSDENKPVARPAHLWKKGQSGNPGGRPKGLEKRVRELVDFDKITLALQDIALGKLPPGITGETTVKIKDRIEASKVLYDRGFGKARSIVDVTNTINESGLGAIDVDALDDAQFEALELTIRRVLGQDDANIVDVIEAHAVEKKALP